MGATSHGLKELESDLQKAIDRAVPEAKKIVGKGCMNIKKQARATIKARSRRGYLPYTHYPRSITYDVTAMGLVVRGEIGPKSEMRQGGLGGLIEYGSVNNAAIPHLTPALDAEEPRFFPYVEDLGVRLLEGRDGPGGFEVDSG